MLDVAAIENVINKNFTLIAVDVDYVLYGEIEVILINCNYEIKRHLEKIRLSSEDEVGTEGIHLGNYNLDRS